jgi:hypothetical protein
MYDRFSDKGAHSAEWFEVEKFFLKLAFAGGHHEAKCPCNRCQNKRMLFEYKMFGHIAKHGFIPNYLVWHQYGEVQAVTPTESGGSDDEDRMDDMIADIGMEYDLGSEDQHPSPEVQNLYRLLAASDEKVHDGTEWTVLQTVTHLMGMKLNYNFLNQCYNDIVKLITDPIPVKHNMLKDLYQSKKIATGLGMNYEMTDVCERNCMLFWKDHKDDTECMHYGRSRYVKVLNEDGASVTIKVAVKQLRYMPITPRLKRLYLSKETAKQMRWHKERNVIVKSLILCRILLILKLGRPWTALIQNLQGTPGVSALACQRMVSNLTARPAVHILAGQLSSCLTIRCPTNV